MQNPLQAVITGAVESAGRAAAGWRVRGLTPLDRRRPSHVQLVEVGFPGGASGAVEAPGEGDDVLRFVVKQDFEAEAGESAVLQALAGTDIPLPQVLYVAQEPDSSSVAMSYLSGVPLFTSLQSSTANWQIAAAATGMARLLARIHALDWRGVVPWMADPAADATQLVLDQLRGRWSEWEELIRQAPGEQVQLFNRALEWLQRRLPTTAELCLCHGDFTPANLLAHQDDTLSVVDWDRALVTDPAWDLALVPFAVSRSDMGRAEADLFMRTFLGAYGDASSRSWQNLPFFIVARLLDGALEVERSGADGGDALDPFAPTLDDYLYALQTALEHHGQFAWQP